MLQDRPLTLDNDGMPANGKEIRVLLVSGGSGGHLIPAVTLADALRSSARCFVLSTRRPVDRLLSEWSQDQWTAVDLQPFAPIRKWFSPRAVSRQIRAIREIAGLIRQARPDVVVGFGVYLSAVGLLIARVSRIPTVIHEQNVVPGRANRWLAGWSDSVALSFPQTRAFFARSPHVEVTGNPIRFSGKAMDREAACRSFGFESGRPVLLIVGGSQGSHAINDLVVRMWEGIDPDRRLPIQVLHVAGSRESAQVEDGYRRLGMEARVFPFLYEFLPALSAATVAVCRAGATSIAEMVAVGLPSILVPYPDPRIHQEENARWMEAVGGAVVLSQNTLTPQGLWREVDRVLFTPGLLDRMRQALRACTEAAAGASGGATTHLGAAAGASGGATTHLGAAASERLAQLVLRVAGGSS